MSIILTYNHNNRPPGLPYLHIRSSHSIRPHSTPFAQQFFVDPSPAAVPLNTQPERVPVIALLGLRGAGKTTIGRRLAKRRRVPFVELDRRVEEAADLTLGEMFTLHGEDYYRKLERTS